MPDFSLSDSLGNPIDISAVKWTSASSLFTYLKSEVLHLAVAPDYVKVKDKPLTQAVPKPTTFKLSVAHDFQFGSATPEIDVTPGAAVELLTNVTAGSDLFEGDSFRMPTVVPAKTGYVGMSFQGSLDFGVSGSDGDLTFGIDKKSSITLQFIKAFATGTGEPTLWGATAAAVSDFVIPANVDSLGRLNANDVCCVSGDGSLKLCGAVKVSLPVNPLASVNLPLTTDTLKVKAGLLSGLSTSLTLSGSYQIRVQKLSTGVVRLSFLRETGSVLKTDLSASAGIAVDVGSTDVLAKLLGAIGTGTVDKKVLDGLTPDQVKTFNSMLKAGLDHSLQVSIDAAVSLSTDKKAVFQYDIQLDELDAKSTSAVNSALRGDLTLMTALEENVKPDGTLAAGVKLLSSVFSTAKEHGIALKLNLLGIVNLISSSKLISNCEFLFEPASGDLTIKETAESDRLSAISDPYKRQEALCKAIFESVLVTTTYVASKAITMPSLSCEATHFAANRNTNKQTIADYTNWFQALDLIGAGEREDLLSRAGKGGLSTCVVRAAFDNASSESLFLNAEGGLRDRTEYLEIGRRAMMALLDTGDSDVDQLRDDFLSDDARWKEAVRRGPNAELRDLMPLQSTDPRFEIVFNDVLGDLADIVWWADSMQKAGHALLDMRTFLAGRDPATLSSDSDFARRRNALQKLMLGVVGSSKVRFHEPWGLVSLFRAAGSRGASGKMVAGSLLLDKSAKVAISSAAV